MIVKKLKQELCTIILESLALEGESNWSVILNEGIFFLSYKCLRMLME